MLDDKILDQNLCWLLSEKGTHSPDVVQHVSTRAGCCSNVDSKGELTLEFHTQVPCSLGGENRKQKTSGYCVFTQELNQWNLTNVCSVITVKPEHKHHTHVHL